MKTCPICEGAVEKVRTKVKVKGIILAEDYEVEKCNSCGEEFLTLEQMSFLRKKAEKKDHKIRKAVGTVYPG